MAEYKMDRAYGDTALDRGAQGLLGQGLDRIEGQRKVTGALRYAHDQPDAANLAYGVAITVPVGRGRVTAIDSAAAAAQPGVIAIITDDPRIPRDTPPFGEPLRTIDGSIAHYGEVVGVAVAETFEAALAAAQAVVVTTEAEPPETDPFAYLDRARTPPAGSLMSDVDVGDLDAAMRAAAVALDITYTTPHHVHAAMEPNAALAIWDGDRVTIHGSMQILKLARHVLAGALGIAPAQVRVLSPYVGGGFGGKTVTPEPILAAIAAQRLGRPVKVALTRRQIFHATCHRSATSQRIRIACDADGRITGLGQESVVTQTHGYQAFEPVALGARSLYAGAARRFATQIVDLNLVPHSAVRAPGEAVGQLAIESAMDEMAERLGIDPIAFRRLNEPPVDPLTGQPFSTRKLLECFDEGARRFGWDRRNPVPGTVREGDWLIGMGMAAAVRINFLVESEARVRLTAAGRAIVESDMTDLGTGAFTVLAQIAGEALGLPMDAIEIVAGDTELPPSAGSGGSFGAASAGSAVALACEELVVELARRMGATPEETTLKDGHAIAGNRRVPLAELLAGQPLEAHGHIRPGATGEAFSQAAHGAHFVEVAVDAVTGEVRVRRMLGVYECGRILNAKTARSQVIGGLIWGIGYALHEAAHVDPRFGNFVNNDLAEYLLPTHADVPHIAVHFIETPDEQANPIRVKGLGELSISGAGAAVTNAIYNACGVRVRDYPLTCDALLAGLPPV